MGRPDLGNGAVRKISLDHLGDSSEEARLGVASGGPEGQTLAQYVNGGVRRHYKERNFRQEAPKLGQGREPPAARHVQVEHD